MKAMYVYYYKSDSTNEPIGRVIADDMVSAIEQIAIVKHLPAEKIEEIFVIQCIGGKK